ncbi:hypothetical protein AWL63_18570 [Sphingomonas panacis]|uniref:Diguanylate cyclase n=1 Tax=Sphingomonas panacis TaxID=1560345 RepID=A0A1B3ZHM7_9SPHN|nr:hypothetical protein AWL63_18570 [Sphingomonas panacis]
MIARGASLEATVAQLCEEIEAMLPDITCTVLRVDRNGLVHPLAGPSLPADYLAGLDNVVIGPQVGSCGTAAYFAEPVIVTDIEHDSRWVRFREPALKLGMKACWSMPIFDAERIVIGTIAFYCRTYRSPGDSERRFIETCVHLCEIAFGRHERVLERERRATTDALTQLPNRYAFNQALSQLPCDEAGAWAVLIIDLDNLKVTNDFYGHDAGDCMIEAVAGRVAAGVAPDRIFRIGGDEFAIIVQQEESLHDLDAFARGILSRLDDPVHCNGSLIAPAATIGGAVFMPEDGGPETVKQNADFALYHAKDSGRGGFIRYWPGLDTRITHRIVAVRNLESALNDRRIEVHYQPVFDLLTGEIRCLEALCRLRNRAGGVVPARDFLDAISDRRLARALTGHMFELIGNDALYWRDADLENYPITVNITEADIREGHVLDQFQRLSSTYPIAPDGIILDLSAHLYQLVGRGEVNGQVQILRGLGIRVTLDDFGTAPVSLRNLLTAPVDAIKIDVGSLETAVENGPETAFIEAAVLIGRRLGIELIAKSIDNRRCAATLVELGCQLGQGMHCSPPLSRDEIRDMLVGKPREGIRSATAV